MRFQYITDDAVNYPGFFVDDISIPEIGYTDDAESDGDWVSEGWIRTDNTIRQRWLVQLIEMDSGADPDRHPPGGGRQRARKLGPQRHPSRRQRHPCGPSAPWRR